MVIKLLDNAVGLFSKSLESILIKHNIDSNVDNFKQCTSVMQNDEYAEKSLVNLKEQISDEIKFSSFIKDLNDLSYMLDTTKLFSIEDDEVENYS